MENEMCGMEMYLDTGCKVRITFDNGETLAGRVLCVEYGDIPQKNDMIIFVVFSRIQSRTNRICSLSSFINFDFTRSAG